MVPTALLASPSFENKDDDDDEKEEEENKKEEGGDSVQVLHDNQNHNKKKKKKNRPQFNVYNESQDFVNEMGISPPYWVPNNTLSWGPCFPETKNLLEGFQWSNSSKLNYRQSHVANNPNKNKRGAV